MPTQVRRMTDGITISAAEDGRRADVALAALAPDLSRSRVKRLIELGNVRLNGLPCRAAQAVRAGDRLEWEQPPPEPLAATAEALPLHLLFEDEHLAVVDKPPGLVIHPGAGHATGTLVNALLHHCKDLSGVGGALRPGIVHRLDKDTSGCVVVAKHDAAHRDLSAQFAGREVLKIYLALVAGVPSPARGTIDAPIARHPVHRKRMAVATGGKGRPAITDYRVLGEIGGGSLVECRLHTGRTHQIRVHLKHLGHPLLGDPLYAGKRASHYPRQMLHAWKLGFRHPATKFWMAFLAPVPEDFGLAGFSIENA